MYGKTEFQTFEDEVPYLQEVQNGILVSYSLEICWKSLWSSWKGLSALVAAGDKP